MPASPRLIAGLSNSASAGPIGCTSGRCALDFGALSPDFLGEFGVFAIGGIWDESVSKKRAGTAVARRRWRCQQLSVAPGLGIQDLASRTWHPRLGIQDLANASLPMTNAERLRKGAKRRSNPADLARVWIASLRSQ